MDATRFDQIVKSLVAIGSRRGVLQLLAALPLAGALPALMGAREARADGSGAGIGGNRRKHKNRIARRHRKNKDDRESKSRKCQPKSKAKTCADKCGTVKNNCKKTVDCGPCECDPPCPACSTCDSDRNCLPCDPCCDDVCCSGASAVCHAQTGACCVPDSHAQTCDGQCGDVLNNCGISENCGPCDCGVCPACHICDDETGDCIPDPNEVGEDCGDGQVCQAGGICACFGESCGNCRTCDGNGICQECSDCCDEGVCVEECGCGEACCDGICCASGQVCQDDTCCTRDCAAVACGSSAPETCGVTNCGACEGGQACIDGTCELVCSAGSCPQGCDCVASPSGSPLCVGGIQSACTGPCQSDADCCPGTSCAAHPVACGGQFVCYVLGPPCD